MSAATVGNWRRWAILSILAWPGTGALRVDDLIYEFERKGWGHLLPRHGRYDAIYRALVAEGDARHVERFDVRPARWKVTDLGSDFAHEFIIGNPNITPEASRG